MKKREYFLRALHEGVYRKKAWIISAFSITQNDGMESIADNPFPYRLFKQDGHYYFMDPEQDGAVEMLEADPEKPPFSFGEKITLESREIPNVPEKTETTYGNLLFNYATLVHAFGDKIDFVTGRVNIKDIEKKIEPILVDDPPEGQPVAKDTISVGEFRRFANAVFFLTGLTQLCVPSASKKTMSVSPEVLKRRDELLEQHKDQLHDPAVVAKIEQELVAMDKKWFEGDEAEGFYIKDKSFDVVRKKSHIMYGLEEGFHDETGERHFIPTSLEEGWDTDKMPAMINSLREGTYSRGTLTALGGESVKFFNRVFQNVTIEGEDCGATMGMGWTVTPRNHKQFEGFYLVTGGKPKLIEVGETNSLVGKDIVVRSPMFCKTPGTSYCETCMGTQNAQYPKGLGAAASEVGSQFMGMFMAAMHGKALKTARYNIDESLL